MNYTPKTDWVDYDENDPLNPDAIPIAVDFWRIENGINDAKNEINSHTSSIASNTSAISSNTTQITDIKKSTHIYGASSGGTDSYAITLTTPFTAYNAGMMINFKADVSNTGAATINVDGKGAKDLKKMTATGKAALETGDVIAGGIYIGIYDGTDFILTNPVSLLQRLLTAQGDMIVASGVNAATVLALGAANKAIISNGTTVEYGYPDNPAYTASDTVILTGNTERSAVGTTYGALKSFKVKYSGTVRLKFEMKGNGEATQIAIGDGLYNNPSSYIASGGAGTTTYTAKSVDVTVCGGRTYTLFGKVSAGGYACYIRNLTVCADKSASADDNAVGD